MYLNSAPKESDGVRSDREHQKHGSRVFACPLRHDVCLLVGWRVQSSSLACYVMRFELQFLLGQLDA
jgi:hypothetical protein